MTVMRRTFSPAPRRKAAPPSWSGSGALRRGAGPLRLASEALPAGSGGPVGLTPDGRKSWECRDKRHTRVPSTCAFAITVSESGQATWDIQQARREPVVGDRTRGQY